jgi:MinD-like ATPase involved in chromosome partitioning or flagellar assembly
MSQADQRRQRVTVISPFGQHQVDLPADMPVAGFLPDLLAMAGLHPSPSSGLSDGWQLADVDGNTLLGSGTLAGQGIGPGAVIRLRGAVPRGVPPPDGWPAPERPGAGQPLPAPPADTGQRRTDQPARGISPGAIFARDRVALSRHVPQQGVPSAPPGDSLTPLDRTEALLPRPVGKVSRIAATVQAIMRPTSGTHARGNRGLSDPADGVAHPAADPDDAEPGAGPLQPAAPAQEHSPAGHVPAAADPTAVEQAEADGAATEGAAAAGQWPDPAALSPSGRVRASSLLPADLTLTTAPSRAERGRARWRELDHLGQLDALITGPRLRRCATIAVVSPKGGVGKTTVTALLGTLFSLLRRDPIVAVDTNPDFGSLGRVLTPDQTWYVDDLARLVTDDDELSLTGLESHLGRAVHGLLVVPAPTDPQRMAGLDEGAYGRVITRLKDFFSLILLDCGTGLQDPASAAAIAAADQVVLLTDAQPATASLVAESTELLHQWGRPITVVVNRMPVRAASLDLQRLSRFLPAARGLVVIPDDVVAATRLAGGSFDWRDAPAGWQLAVRRLAVVLVTDWQRLGLTRD